MPSVTVTLDNFQGHRENMQNFAQTETHAIASIATHCATMPNFQFQLTKLFYTSRTDFHGCYVYG